LFAIEIAEVSRKTIMSQIIFFGFILLVSFSAICLLFRSRFALFNIRSTSMEPTIKMGEKVLIIRRFAKAGFNKGQIVAFRLPPDEKNIIKRIVAVEGETFVTPPYTGEEKGDSWIIPPGHVFLMGDQFGGADSRVWGPIPNSHIFGVVLARLSSSGIHNLITVKPSANSNIDIEENQ